MSWMDGYASDVLVSFLADMGSKAVPGSHGHGPVMTPRQFGKITSGRDRGNSEQAKFTIHPGYFTSHSPLFSPRHAHHAINPSTVSSFAHY